MQQQEEVERKESERGKRKISEEEAQSESCGCFSNCWLVAAGTAGTAAAGGGAVENGKMEKQPTNRTITKYHPPSRPAHPPPCLLQARKIYSEKYILQFSSDFGPQGAALATLVEQQRKG